MCYYYLLNIIHSVHFNVIFKVRQWNFTIDVIKLYICRTLNILLLLLLLLSMI
jgi:hypothetical protein